MSEKCQCTKSLRSSPLRGSKSREAGSRSREYSDRLGDKVNAINKLTVGVQRMVKISKKAWGAPVTQWQNCLDESATQFA